MLCLIKSQKSNILNTWLTPFPSLFHGWVAYFFFILLQDNIRTHWNVLDFKFQNFVLVTINFTLNFSNFKEKLRKPCLADLISITIVTFSCRDISHTHLTHLPQCSLLLANYHSRKHITLHMIVMSKSSLIK